MKIFNASLGRLVVVVVAAIAGSGLSSELSEPSELSAVVFAAMLCDTGGVATCDVDGSGFSSTCDSFGSKKRADFWV